jgi:hypothetical protein
MMGMGHETEMPEEEDDFTAESIDEILEAILREEEEEMSKEYGDNWEIMDDIQKKLAKDTVLSNKIFDIIKGVAEESKKTEEWLDKAQKFSQDPVVVSKYPQLEGRETEFIQFCSLPTRVGVDMDDLVRAFSFDRINQNRYSLEANISTCIGLEKCLPK